MSVVSAIAVSHLNPGARWRRLAVATVAAIGALACMVGPASAATQVFSYTGGEQTFMVPAGASSVSVVAIGGSGGTSSMIAGGLGAQVSGTLSVTPGEVLYVEVA